MNCGRWLIIFNRLIPLEWTDLSISLLCILSSFFSHHRRLASFTAATSSRAMHPFGLSNGGSQNSNSSHQPNDQSQSPSSIGSENGVCATANGGGGGLTSASGDAGGGGGGGGGGSSSIAGGSGSEANNHSLNNNHSNGVNGSSQDDDDVNDHHNHHNNNHRNHQPPYMNGSSSNGHGPFKKGKRTFFAQTQRERDMIRLIGQELRQMGLEYVDFVHFVDNF